MKNFFCLSLVAVGFWLCSNAVNTPVVAQSLGSGSCYYSNDSFWNQDGCVTNATGFFDGNGQPTYSCTGSCFKWKVLTGHCNPFPLWGWCNTYATNTTVIVYISSCAATILPTTGGCGLGSCYTPTGAGKYSSVVPTSTCSSG